MHFNSFESKIFDHEKKIYTFNKKLLKDNFLKDKLTVNILNNLFTARQLSNNKQDSGKIT